MKKLLSLLVLVSIAFVLQNCTTQEDVIEEQEVMEEVLLKNSSSNQPSKPINFYYLQQDLTIHYHFLPNDDVISKIEQIREEYDINNESLINTNLYEIPTPFVTDITDVWRVNIKIWVVPHPVTFPEQGVKARISSDPDLDYDEPL